MAVESSRYTEGPPWAANKMINLLFDVGCAARRTKDFEVANAVFAIIFDWMCGGPEISKVDSSDFEDRSLIEIKYETDNDYRDEGAYYDLLSLIWGDRRLAIPVPLLTRAALIVALRQGAVPVQKGDYPSGAAPGGVDEDTTPDDWALIRWLGGVPDWVLLPQTI
ncbi:hypothetical protein KGO04_01550 [Patescibacteria group bacterium]|nr:hypothetical protein [Patescibacteria group bacterium]MDE1945259.1 hypothetical protein [Patescibacteria group bacterium]